MEGGAEDAKGYCDGEGGGVIDCQAIVSAPDCKLKVNMGCKWYGEGDGKGEGRLPQNKTMHHPTESTLPR